MSLMDQDQDPPTVAPPREPTVPAVRTRPAGPAGPARPARPAGPAGPGGPVGPAGPVRHRWVRPAAVLAAAVLVLGSGEAVYLVMSGDDPTPVAIKGPDRNRAGVPTAALGVFRGTDPDEVDAFQAWLGSKVDFVVDFSTRDTWDQIANPAYMIDAWRNTPYRQVYSLAMLPEQDGSASIEQGATGAYDQYYVQLAQHLVDAGQQDAVLRLGWEFNLESSRWATGDADAWKAYWRHIVTAMRSVDGQAFEFDWNPNNGKNQYDAVNYYPGDDVVDYVGIDAYDTSWAFRSYPYPEGCDAACRLERQQRAWENSIYGGARGLRFWSTFARHHGKPMSLPEWGLWQRLDGHGGGANPYYLKQMAAFIDDPINDVAYQAYFENDGADGAHRLMTTFGGPGEQFRKLFAG